MPWAEAFAMMHDDSRQIVGVASSVDRGTWACAAVRFDVQNLVKSHMDADFLPMVPPRPPAVQEEVYQNYSQAWLISTPKPGTAIIKN